MLMIDFAKCTDSTMTAHHRRVEFCCLNCQKGNIFIFSPYTILMKKIFLFFLLTILFSILVYGVGQEHTLLAKVTVNPVPGTLTVSPDNLPINTVPLSLVEKNLSFSQLAGNQDLNVTLFLEISDIITWLSFSETNFNVTPLETKDITAFIDIPNVTAGTYSGNIHALTNIQDLIIPVNITVIDKYKISVKIDALERKVKPGNDVSVLTQLTKAKQRRKDPELDGKITVDLEYNIFKQKTLITTLTTTIDVADFNEKTVSIHIPLNASKGKYTVEVTATHLDKSSSSKDGFQVTTNIVGKILNFFKNLF